MSSFLEEFPENFPCPICGELREIKISKKQKPYYFCDPCGVQVFIRNKIGISRFSEMKNNTELYDKINSLDISDSSNLLRLFHRIKQIKEEINRIENAEIILSEENEEKRDKLIKKSEILENQYQNLLLESDAPLYKEEAGV